MPHPLTSIGRCGARATASTWIRAPAAWVRSSAARTSGAHPVRFDAPVIATHATPPAWSSRSRSARSSVPSLGSTGSIVTVAPASRAASTQGVTFESWSSWVQMIRSEPLHVRASARVQAKTSAVALGPKMTCEPCAPRSAPTCSRTVSTNAVVSRLAANAPPVFAGAELVRYACIASIDVSTGSVPAGPSRRTHSSSPGNRSRDECMTIHHMTLAVHAVVGRTTP